MGGALVVRVVGGRRRRCSPSWCCCPTSGRAGTGARRRGRRAAPPSSTTPCPCLWWGWSCAATGCGPTTRSRPRWRSGRSPTRPSRSPSTIPTSWRAAATARPRRSCSMPSGTPTRRPARCPPARGGLRPDGQLEGTVELGGGRRLEVRAAAAGPLAHVGPAGAAGPGAGRRRPTRRGRGARPLAGTVRRRRAGRAHPRRLAPPRHRPT